MRENLRDARNNLFAAENLRAGQLSFQRPVLIILDRNLDMATPLHHTWTYQALVHDVLDLESNRVRLDISSDPARKQPKEYDLNDHDNFWTSHKGRYCEIFPKYSTIFSQYFETLQNILGFIKIFPNYSEISFLEV